MATSYVDKVTERMHELLWQNILEEWLTVQLPILLPWLAWPIIGPIANKLIRDAIDNYLAEPLFTLLSRFGVFTSIDWKEDSIYDAYEVEAKKLVIAQDGDTWSEKDEKDFTDAARKLIRFNLKFSS